VNILLRRYIFTNNSTIGDLIINDDWFCFTLEDPVRPVKIAGETAIPMGQYEVIVNFSNRFQRMMPLLLNVPHYDGVRIHPGNSASDTEGCILLGEQKGVDVVSNSRAAFNDFFTLLTEALKTGKVYITITEQH
jgi:hypothetical protein